MDEPPPQPADPDLVVDIVLHWYTEHRRDLPWRSAERTPWGVLVSEVMLQQTPVVRVLPVWLEWMARWPEPADLASDPSSSAVAAWGRLGYPRRALRLHAAATAIATDHDGRVPSDLATLRTLPGVGEYTAAAVASFAFGRRAVVLDTNVRRVLARVAGGVEFPADHLTRAERDLAAAWTPDDPRVASTWAVAAMELGALVCTAKAPACDRCPVSSSCRWFLAGRPAHQGKPRRGQAWHGTDRQCRGVMLAELRESPRPLGTDELLALWTRDADQAQRCLDSLSADGLARRSVDGWTL
ncbi:A/G-specific adenine glycosylase [Aestuariimicrobium sp. T2.26MG-19.2B]|uniref:A/G-specific adenine glycosylase n=1 Tax=Aestuariimicrobium sp. T2.26MG-19.2B TaxID=3040679 RepID=UPI002477A763|nr:A/G-specific adenine glycosylase [Aestuariimicrobium sp. T2.26MG-19.2B]CAI9405179.1 Adenine DNA glycosylase [Aestuariimicrobium sp. T2.26MG-19.2B]